MFSIPVTISGGNVIIYLLAALLPSVINKAAELFRDILSSKVKEDPNDDKKSSASEPPCMETFDADCLGGDDSDSDSSKPFIIRKMSCAESDMTNLAIIIGRRTNI